MAEEMEESRGKKQEEQVNIDLVNKYRVDNTILESYFKNAKSQNVNGMTFPLRIDNRQYCSPTDYQGDKPSCCGYSTAQIMESMNWMETGRLVQFDANQIYAKAKETDGQMGAGGTYPDLAMQKGLELAGWERRYSVGTSSSRNVDELKRVIHGHLFATVNIVATKDLYGLNAGGFVYIGDGEKAGGHSLVCCGYDEESRMLIMQNHWGKTWGLKGFFLCPYDVWKRQCNLFCWYENKVEEPPPRKRSKAAKMDAKKVEEEKEEPASSETKLA